MPFLRPELATSQIQDELCLPIVPGRKSANERFAGAVETYTIEASKFGQGLKWVCQEKGRYLKLTRSVFPCNWTIIRYNKGIDGLSICLERNSLRICHKFINMFLPDSTEVFSAGELFGRP